MTPETAVRDDYLELCKGVRTLSGIDLSRYKRVQMERRIRTHARRIGVTDLNEYLRVLRKDPAELDSFLDRVTINVSSLWRSPEQWKLMAEELVPELAKTGRIRIWSAGCSIGAEAYTAAAVCRDAAPAGTTVTVLGTDVDRRVVKTAAIGEFPESAATAAPKAALQKHFDRMPDGGWKANAKLKQGVRFETGDLLEDRVRPAQFDLVICRNTVIYFTAPDRDMLHAKLASAVRPGGFLMIGPTERVASPADAGVENFRPFVFRRP
ncbi:protein-glutamate O-methyltransferase CheR [Patulibacter sp. SYSU D01012]|uniref:CheR family methyltransferase n=1 Tax=Patulibacter sp. SYSU D01012 TaxID=2817381 RepID=UPI001B30119B|nr:protein-glutamate O-methyltransferase CheR [Patulibacter sp. SYSU D01012]